jgi:prepilin-type N-terminal cleavage/methylation domain-containing protein
MNPPFPSRSTSAARNGFTMIEILVAITVLAILMAFIAQLLNNASILTAKGMKRMDADTQARMALDRMALDLSKMILRKDLDYLFDKKNGNDQMAFFSESTGYFPSGVTGTTPKSNVSLVGYRIKDNKLERLSKGLIWNGVTSATSGASGLGAGDNPLVFLPRTISLTWPNVAGTGGDADYQVIADQVFRMEFCFVVKNDTTDPVLSSDPFLSPNTATNLNGLSDVVAVVVSIAVLDTKSRLIISTTQLNDAGGVLNDVSGSVIPDLPLKLWRSKVNSGLGLPPASASNVRIYQRYCYLNR